MGVLNSLNRQQRQAASFVDGPAIVLSGPGSGKTRVITHRIAYLIGENKISPEKILAVTFTNKAANEMKERVQKLLGDRSKGVPAMGTFHALCAKILREDGYVLGLGTGFWILNELVSLTFLKKAFRRWK